MKVNVEKLDHMGRGIGYINGKVVFVSDSIPGDIVDINIIKENKNYMEGKINKIVELSKNRIKPICPYYNLCGGCNLQNLTYENTIKYKKERLENIFEKLGIKENIEFIKNDHFLNYRNKISLKIIDGSIGFYKEKTHEIVEINSCAITKNSINDFIKEIKNFNIINGDIIIRCNYNDELLISIRTLDDIKIKDDYSKYKVVGIVLNDDLIYGENHFLEKVNNTFFEVSYDSFFQVNSYINEKLFDIIKEHSKGDTILDLYSGVGTLSIMASYTAKKVYGIEIIPNAVINAIKNAKINKRDNINFILGKVEDKIKFINDKIDTIIFDPPRSGLDNITIQKTLDLKPNKIIYISCENQKLTSDLKSFLNDYNIKKVYGLDMFSYSYHTECVCILERK